MSYFVRFFGHFCAPLYCLVLAEHTPSGKIGWQSGGDFSDGDAGLSPIPAEQPLAHAVQEVLQDLIERWRPFVDWKAAAVSKASRGASRKASERARIQFARGKRFRSVDLARILKAQKNRCAICTVSFNRAKRHLDHIVPVARGGSNDLSNFQYLCGRCNLKKGAQDALTFMRSLGRLL